MKKFGIFVLMLGALGMASVGCEPAKKKEAPKTEPAAATTPAETPAAPPAETPAAEAPKTEEAPK